MESTSALDGRETNYGGRFNDADGNIRISTILEGKKRSTKK